MALAATQVWEVRTTGDPANSGGFNSAAAGTDRSQQDAPHVIIDGAAITATVNATTTDLDIVGYAVSAADIGNTVRITGGTMTAGTYQIDSIPAAGRWRLDRSAGTAAQTGTGRMGGANSDPALVAAVSVGLNTVWVRSGTYPFTSATQNVAGGCVNTPGGAQVWFGYGSARGDFGTAPVFQASGINTATLFALSQNDCKAFNIEVDGAALAAIRGIDATSRVSVYLCNARNCTNSGIRFSSTESAFIACGVSGCTTAGAGFLDAAGGQAGTLYGCWARANTVTGFSLSGYYVRRSIAASNTGATTDGFVVVSNKEIDDCIAYGNGRDGFRFAGTNGIRAVNCVAEANVGAGFNNTGSGTNLIMLGCATFGNGSSISGTAPLLNRDFVTGTASFFVAPAAGNFALNNTVGGGAAIKQNAEPASYIDGLTVSYTDRGAVQTSGAPGTGGGGGGGTVLLGPGAGIWMH
jgi:hypothetical protein